MSQKHHPTILLVLGLSILHRLHASLYHHHQHGPLHSPYSTSTTLFDHVIQHQAPHQHSRTAFKPSLPDPTPIITAGNNLQFLTSNASPSSHARHPDTIYARPQSAHLRPYSHQIQYQPGRGAALANAFGYTGGLFGLPPLTGHLDHITDLTYIVDGRILKQYFVMENHDEDNTLDSFLNDPVNRNAYVPFLPHLNFGANNRNNQGFPSGAQYRQQAAPLKQQPSYAVGSGSLGFVRHPNGAIYLGSGSLGYINDQQRSNALQDIRNRPNPGAGPLSFGHSPK